MDERIVPDGTGRGEPYVCMKCGTVSIATWSDAEAAAEHKAIFGFVPPEDDRAYLCDDCWDEFIPWAQEQGIIQGKRPA